MAKNKREVNSNDIGNIKYKMSKELADSLLKSRKGADKNKHPQDYLCALVNEQFGAKGNCIEVLTTL